MLLGPEAPIPLDLTKFCLAETAAYAQQRPLLRLGDVTIEADRMDVEVEERRHTFHGRVLMRYFETTMEAESAIVDLMKGKITLSSNILITDPWGTLRAECAEADIEEIPSDTGPGIFVFKGGIARGVELVALEGRIRAETLHLMPRMEGQRSSVIKMTGVMATACDRRTPDFQFRFRELTAKPGDVATWKGGQLLLGKGFSAGFPDYYTILGPQETGILLPQPLFTSGFRPGYRWRNVFPLTNETQAYFEQTAAFDGVPIVNMRLAYSLEPRAERDKRKPIAVRDESGERFRNGYWDNVTVREMRHEEASISGGATIVYGGRSMNIGAVQRPGTGLRYDRDWFVGAQASGMLGRLPWQAQLEYGPIRERLTHPGVNRVEAHGSLLLTDVQIADGLFLRARADVGSFFGDATNYTWIRPLAGFVYQPSDELVFSAAYFKALTLGSPHFDIDRLYSMQALHFRTDFNFPATTVSLLLKYDFDRRELYDIEVGLSQLMHCVRPYIAYRKDPGAITFGFELEAQRLFEALSKQNPRRVR